MKKIGLLLIVLILLLTGCGGGENASGNLDDNGDNSMPMGSINELDDDKESKGYVFEYNGTTIAMNEKAESILET